MSPAGKLIYAWATYLLLRLIYAVNNVPYASLTGVLTGDPDERTSIASYRQIFANLAGFIVQSLAIPMVLSSGAATTRAATSSPWGCCPSSASCSSSSPSPARRSASSPTRSRRRS